MLRAAVRAAYRRHASMAAADEGFMLIYVLMITAIITVLVTSTLVVTSGSVIPAQQAAYSMSAANAAESGLQQFLYYANTNCSAGSATMTDCTLPSSTGSGTVFHDAAGYSSTYTWSAVKGIKYFRVTATGTARLGGISSTRQITADVTGGLSVDTFNYGVVTRYETQAPDLVLSQFPSRRIALDPAVLKNAGLAATGTTVNWNGAPALGTPGSVNVCNSVFYGSGGRANNPPPAATNPYVDWAESGSIGAADFTDYQPCQVSMGHSTRLLEPASDSGGSGGYYSQDAVLLSNGYPGGTGPLLDQQVSTGYQYDPAVDGSCGVVGQNYRAFNLGCIGYPTEVGGAPAPSSTQKIIRYVAAGPQIPGQSSGSSVMRPLPNNACVYNGPTRVTLNGDGTATVTSPHTTTAWESANASFRPGQCYTGAGASGMTAQQISLTAPQQINMIYVQNDGSAPSTPPAAHSSTGWNLTGQRLGDTASSSNTVFYLTGSTPPTNVDSGLSTAPDSCPPTALYGYQAASGYSCAWTNVYSVTDGNGGGAQGWTAYKGSTSTKCSSLAQTDRQQFECDWGAGSVASGHDNYSTYRALIKNDLGYKSCQTGTTTAQLNCLTTLLNTDLATANSSSHRYVVMATATGPATVTATKTLSTNPAPDTGDPLFDSTTRAGTPTVESQTTVPLSFTIGRQIYGCYTTSGTYDATGNACTATPATGTNTWGNGSSAATYTPQFTTTVTQVTWNISAAGSSGVSYFPNMSDVTQYATGTAGTTGPGDLYVEGTAPSTLLLEAQNDVVVTNNLRPSGAAALEAIGRNNVRIYHPVKCVATDFTAISNTTPGFCPNDVTGLYNTVLPDGSRPDQQYSNMRTDLSNLNINAAVFALGTAPSTVTCPLWSGTGICGGTFTTDNDNRGSSTATLGSLTLTGCLVTAHHGALGEEWEVPDSSTATSRPYSGYQFTDRFQNLESALSTVTPFNTVVNASANWRIVSRSS